MKTLNFASAYKQLRPAEKLFVDGYVAMLENEAHNASLRISALLYREIPPHIMDASQGMFERPMVVAAITERVNEIALASELTAHKVIKELSSLAFSTMADYVKIGEDGFPDVDLANCTPEQLSALAAVDSEIVVSPRGTVTRKVKIKTYDKLAALTNLMRYMGMLDTDNPHWKADQAQVAYNKATPTIAHADQDMGDIYAKMLNQ